MTADCVICRRQLCADYRTCRGELAALCARVEERRQERSEVAEFVIWPCDPRHAVNRYEVRRVA